MSTWRRKAIELFPEIKREIEESLGPGEAWIYIEENLLDAFLNGDNNYIKSVKQYFSWSISTRPVDSPHQAALCGFLEDIGREKKYWPYFPKLFTKRQFELYMPSLSYSISEKEKKVMENAFYNK